MTPGTRVRIPRPDKPAHATGVVAEPIGDTHRHWPVWVRHECDCWTTGTKGYHTRGYDESEVVAG